MTTVSITYSSDTETQVIVESDKAQFRRDLKRALIRARKEADAIVQVAEYDEWSGVIRNSIYSKGFRTVSETH